MQKALLYLNLTLAAFLSVAIFSSYTAEEKQQEENGNILVDKNLPQIIRSVDLDKSFDFAGEPLPMENFDVRERLDRELMVNSYWHSSTLLNIKNAVRYFPEIERILAENGVPDDFKYLAVAESGLRNVSSPAGAKGTWQFLKSTGASYGMEINSEVDERYHLEKSTQAACEYLSSAKKRLGSWSLAAAAYNMGTGRVAGELKKQRADNYYDLNLNLETARYIFRIVAIKEILNQPSRFGFFLDDDDGYPPLTDFDTVEVSGAVENWGDFALEHGTTYRMIKLYNPWLISSKLVNAKRKTYQIRIPKRKF